MGSLPSDITVPGRPGVHEVSPGAYACIQRDGHLVDQQRAWDGPDWGEHIPADRYAFRLTTSRRHVLAA